MVFLPTDADDAAKAERRIEELAAEEGLRRPGVAGRARSSPDASGRRLCRAMPRLAQVVVAPDAAADRRTDALALDRLAFCLRKRVEHEVHGVYVASLSARTLVYKGMLTGHQLGRSSPTSPTRASTAGWPSSTRGSRPTPSRRGPWPTRTAIWPTTARSTPCGGTGTGCGPARRCSQSDLIPGDLERLFPICDPDGQRLGRRSTRCSSSSTSGGGACPTPCS